MPILPASILLTASLGEVRGFGEAERRKREPSRGTAGAEGVRCGEGCPEKNFFSIFGLQTATFGALWGLLLRFSGLFWTQTDVA